MKSIEIKPGLIKACILTVAIVCASSICLGQQGQPDSGTWKSLFDGKSLDGWKKVGSDDSKWEVVDGVIQGSGRPSMLVTTGGPYKDFRYRVEMKINDGGNSGLYFRTKPEPGFVDGYEAQVDSTHTDPIRTGSIYGMCHVYQKLVEPDTWFTYEIEVRDDVWRGREMTRIKVTVDGNELYEYLDFEKTFKEGHFAFQQHDPGSRVSIRKVEVIDLGSDDADDQQPQASDQQPEEDLPTNVTIEKHSRRDANRFFKFVNVPAPSETDAGNLATVTLVRGQADANAADVTALQDGSLPAQEDQPSANFFLAGTRPGWLVEGIADHLRWYQFEPVQKRRRVNWDRANYDDAYFNSATFLDYIVREIDPDAIKKINAICRQGRYRDEIWVTLYGKSAPQIWAEAKKAGLGK